MIARLTSLIRDRWHPLWRLRKIPAFRRFQQRFDRTVSIQIPGTGVRVAVKLFRDASWITNPASLDPAIRSTFTLVLDLLKPPVFWDIGANIGFYSWRVRQHPAVQQVVMFEPDPTNFGLITETIRQNGILNCRALNIALSDKCGETTFLVDRASGATGSLEATSHRENTSSLHHAYQMSETITCATATIDSLIGDGLPRPKLIKIDVEGAEHLVLAGAGGCLAQDWPALIVETGNGDLVQRMCAIGYKAFQIDEGNVLFVPVQTGHDLAPFASAFAECAQAA